MVATFKPTGDIFTNELQLRANWQCPHCLAWSSLDNEQYQSQSVPIKEGNARELSALQIRVVVCKNFKCRKATITAELHGYVHILDHRRTVRRLSCLRRFDLEPESRAKPQPSYIPRQIVADYVEAYLIAPLSPKASATLSRRCLQGMIRDFFHISRRTLGEEINAIKDQIPAEVWDAIDAVRKIGNIGAHMKKDVDLIVDVDENEATLLLTLIEQLFGEWYVARREREERLAAIKGAAAQKEDQRKAGPVVDAEASAPQTIEIDQPSPEAPLQAGAV